MTRKAPVRTEPSYQRWVSHVTLRKSQNTGQARLDLARFLAFKCRDGGLRRFALRFLQDTSPHLPERKPNRPLLTGDGRVFRRRWLRPEKRPLSAFADPNQNLTKCILYENDRFNRRIRSQEDRPKLEKLFG
jgi:hypothetical protein